MTPDASSPRRESRLLVLLLILTFLALLGTAAYTYLAYRQAAAELVMQRDQQVAYLSAARLRSEFDLFAGNLTSLARLASAAPGDAASRPAVLSQAAFRVADFDAGVYLLDRSGKVASTLPPLPEVVGQDWSRRDVYRQVLATQDVAFSNSLPSGASGERIIIIGVPILGERGEFAGAVMGTLQLGEPAANPFHDALARLRLEQTGDLYLVDGTGIILYDSDADLAGRSFATSVAPGLVLGDQPGSERRKTQQGRDVVLSYAPVPGTPWTLVTQSDWLALTASTRTYANLLLAALSAGMLVPTVAVGVLARQRNQRALDQERAQQEALVARRVQEALTSRQLPLLPGWDIAVHRPSRQAAQHLVDDHLLLPDGRLMISLMHLTGDGMSGAVSMITGRSALRGAAQCNLEPSEALHRANQLLCLDNPAGHPAFGLFAVLDPERAEVVFARAGLEAPTVHPAPEEPHPAADLGGLGLRPLETHAAGQVHVAPGAVLILSAGLIEGRNPAGQPFGVERVRACLTAGAADGAASLEVLLAQARQFGLPVDQAALIVLLKREPAPGSGGEDAA